MFIFNVPDDGPDQNTFYDSLVRAIRSILQLSQDWDVEILKVQKRGLRGINVLSKQLFIVFSSSFTNLSEERSIQMKVEDTRFAKSLNALGFDVSINVLSGIVTVADSGKNVTNGSYLTVLTDNSSASLEGQQTSNTPSPSIIKALPTSVGIIVFLAIASFLLYKKTGDTKRNSQAIKITVLESTLNQFRENVRNDIKNHTDTLDDCGQKEPLHESPYSKELSEVIQLLARAEIQTSSFDDLESLRRLEEATIVSTHLSANDTAAILQLISKIEIDSSLFSFIDLERKQLLQERISMGPFNENHSLVLKLITDIEMSDVKSAFTGTDCGLRPGSCDDPNSNDSLADIMHLLKTCGVDARFLLHTEGRKVIEDSILRQSLPIKKEHACLLQMLSILEKDSNDPLSQEREEILRKRIEIGPLTTASLAQLKSTLCLAMKREEGVSTADWSQHTERIAHLAANIENTAVSSRSDSSSGRKAETLIECSEMTLVPNKAESSSFAPVNNPENTEVHAGVECSFLSREDKQALILLELKERTASIRNSLPQLVQNGILPVPKGKPASYFTSDAAMESDPRLLRNLNEFAIKQQMSMKADPTTRNHTVPKQADPEAVVISVNVRADLIFPEEPGQEFCALPAADAEPMDKDYETETQAQRPYGLFQHLCSQVYDCVWAVISYGRVSRH